MPPAFDKKLLAGGQVQTISESHAARSKRLERLERHNKVVQLDVIESNLCLCLPFPQKKSPHLRCLCSRGSTRGSIPSAAETTIGHDAKTAQMIELRLPCWALCAEAKRIALLAGFCFSRLGLPWEGG